MRIADGEVKQQQQRSTSFRIVVTCCFPNTHLYDLIIYCAIVKKRMQQKLKNEEEVGEEVSGDFSICSSVLTTLKCVRVNDDDSKAKTIANESEL